MKDNKVRKFLLPIGVLAISTLPFVSVVSCSKGGDDSKKVLINNISAFYNPNTQNVEIKINGQNLPNDINSYVIKIDSAISNNFTITNHTLKNVKLVSKFNTSLVGKTISVSLKGNNNETTTSYPSKDQVSENEMLNFFSAIPEVNYDRDGWMNTISSGNSSQYWDENYDNAYRFMTKDQFRTIRNKVLNDEIKWFEDDGITPIKYEISVTINEGMMISNGRANLNKPYDSTEYGTPSYNVWKTLPNKTSTSIVFWKKANNKSFNSDDFEFESNLYILNGVIYKKAFDLNSNICIGKNALSLTVSKTGKGGNGFLSFTDMPITDEEYNQIKNKYTTKDSQFANYVEGDKKPDTYVYKYVSNISGTISIKPLNK